MKGIVFVKLGEFVEQTWSYEFWDELLCNTELASGGIYTSAGLYDDQELVALVGAISSLKGMTTDDAQKAFGHWVFKELYAAAPSDVHQFIDVFTFLRAVQDVIHVEVKKLNPDVLLPEFDFLEETQSSLTFHYKSPRKMCQFCEGLIYGLADHTKQSVEVIHKSCEHKGDDICVLQVNKLAV